MPYVGESVDLFASAVILFTMVSQHPPFLNADESDLHYRCIAANRSDIFWKEHSKSKPNGEEFYSEDFMNLVEQMLEVKPEDRLKMADVLAHPWMVGPTPSKEEVI